MVEQGVLKHYGRAGSAKAIMVELGGQKPFVVVQEGQKPLHWRREGRNHYTGGGRTNTILVEQGGLKQLRGTRIPSRTPPSNLLIYILLLGSLSRFSLLLM